MSSGEYKVLLVDDCELFRMRMSYLLLYHNLYPVFEATNYEEACDRLTKSMINLVLLDISLPGKSGIELLKLIKNKYPDTKVMMVSNHVNDYYKQFCLLYGADHVFDKSLDYEDIEGMLAQLNKSEPGYAFFNPDANYESSETPEPTQRKQLHRRHR